MEGHGICFHKLNISVEHNISSRCLTSCQFRPVYDCSWFDNGNPGCLHSFVLQDMLGVSVARDRKLMQEVPRISIIISMRALCQRTVQTENQDEMCRIFANLAVCCGNYTMWQRNSHQNTLTMDTMCWNWMEEICVSVVETIDVLCQRY